MQIPGWRSRRDEKWKARNRRESEIERPIALANPIPNSSSFARPNHVSDAAQPWKNNPNFFPLLNYLGDSVDSYKATRFLSNAYYSKKSRLSDNIVSNLASGRFTDRCARSSIQFLRIQSFRLVMFQREMTFAKAEKWSTDVERIEGIVIYLKSGLLSPFDGRIVELRAFVSDEGDNRGPSNALVRLFLFTRQSVCFSFSMVLTCSSLPASLHANESTFLPNRQNKSSRAWQCR